MRGLWAVHLTLAFALEVAALVVLGGEGASIGTTAVVSVTLAVLLPSIAAVLWGLYAAPRARFQIQWARSLVKVAVFAAAAAAMYDLRGPMWTAAFVAVLAVSAGLGQLPVAKRWDAEQGVAHSLTGDRLR